MDMQQFTIKAVDNLAISFSGNVPTASASNESRCNSLDEYIYEGSLNDGYTIVITFDKMSQIWHVLGREVQSLQQCSRCKDAPFCRGLYRKTSDVEAKYYYRPVESRVTPRCRLNSLSLV